MREAPGSKSSTEKAEKGGWKETERKKRNGRGGRKKTKK